MRKIFGFGGGVPRNLSTLIAKSTPVGVDLIITGDSTAGFAARKTTVTEYITLLGGSFALTEGTYVVGQSAGCSTFAAAVATLNALGTDCTLVVPSGTHDVSVDLPVNSNIHLRMLKGASFNIGTVDATGNLAYTYTAGTGTVTTTVGNRCVIGTSSFATQLPTMGMYMIIAHAGGEATYQVRTLNDNSATKAHLYTAPASADAGVAFRYSNLAITGTNFVTDGIEPGDFLYSGVNTLVVKTITGETAGTIYRHNGAEITSGVYTRSVRLKINGTIEAGKYKIFSGDGVAKLAQATIYPEWWGAKSTGVAGDAATNSTAFEKAAYSMNPASATTVQDYAIRLSKGRYYINKAIPILSGSRLLVDGAGGQQGYGTSIYAATTFNDVAMIYGINVYNPEICGLMLNAQAAPVRGNAYPDGIYIYNSTGNVAGKIHNNHLWQVSGAGIAFAGSASRAQVVDNYISSNLVGVRATYDMWVSRNEIAAGDDIVLNGTFADTSSWTWGAGGGNPDWYLNAGAATHANGGGVVALSQSLTIYPNLFYCIVFDYTRSAGSIDISFGGSSIISGLTAAGTYYYYMRVDDPEGDSTLKFTPTTTFAGTIDNVKVYSGHGVYNHGADNKINDNIIFGDSGGCSAILAFGSRSACFDNRLGPFAVGAIVYNSIELKENLFLSNLDCGVYLGGNYTAGNTGNAVIDNNTFSGARYSVRHAGTANNTTAGSIIRNNKFLAYTVSAFKGLQSDTPNWAYVINNIGYDIILSVAGYYDPPNTVTGNMITATAVTVTGASLGDLVLMSYDRDLQDLVYGAYVSAANTVQAKLWNGSGADRNILGYGAWCYQVIPARYARYTSPAYNPGNVVAGTFLSFDFTVPGVALGDFVYATSDIDIGGLMAPIAAVTAADTVTVTLFNPTVADINPAASNWRVFVVPGSKAKTYVAVNEGAIADAAGATTVCTDPSALIGDFVMIAPGVDTTDFLYSGYVQANGLVEIRQQNETGAGPTTLANSNWRIWRGTTAEAVELFK